MQQHAENVAEQDEILDELSKSMDEIKAIATSINRGLKMQDVMLHKVDDKIDSATEKLTTANTRLHEILESNGGMSRWCPIIICLIVLIALVGYILSIV